MAENDKMNEIKIALLRTGEKEVPITYMWMDKFMSKYIYPLSRLAEKKQVRYDTDFYVYDKAGLAVFPKEIPEEEKTDCFIYIKLEDDNLSEDIDGYEVAVLIVIPLKDIPQGKVLLQEKRKLAPEDYGCFYVGKPKIIANICGDVGTAYYSKRLLSLAIKMVTKILDRTREIGFVAISTDYWGMDADEDEEISYT